MRIAVCDDQPEVLDSVTHMLKNTGIASEDSVAVYSDIRHLKEIFQEEELPDVLLMDICHEKNRELPAEEEHQAGIKCAYELNQEYPDLQIIYMTENATKYFQHIFLKPVNLVGYLTKPIDPVILKKFFDIVRKRQKYIENKRVVIMCRHHKQMFYLDEICYLESRGHQTPIHLDQKKEVCRDKLSDLEERMGEQFVRCHQSFLVNMKYIRRIERESLILENGENISISKKRYLETKEKYFLYLEKERI